MSHVRSQPSLPVAPDTLPRPVTAWLEARYGRLVALMQLGGMRGGSVYQARFSGVSVVVKASATPRELHFYRNVAGALAKRGIAAPALLWSTLVEDTAWLVLEDLPQLRPRRRWSADHELLGVLCRLHVVTAGSAYLPTDMGVRALTEPMNERMLARFSAAAARELGPRLARLQRAGAHLFRPWCNLAGDPSEANWGRRADGTLVLLDWARFGLGTPALDLARTVPGLGDSAAFAQVAGSYHAQWQRHRDSVPWTAGQLCNDIVLAKLWTIVALMSTEGTATRATSQPTMEELVTRVPAWIAWLESFLDRA